MNPKVDDYISKSARWQSEMSALRMMLLDCMLTEEIKWRVPCYTFGESNIAIIGNFKDYCTLSFFKGVLLQDTEGILVSPGENSQTVRMVRFTSVKEIKEQEATLKAYIFEAIEVEKAGLKVEFTESKNLVFPEELVQKLKDNPEFKTAFEALTIGKQRAYNLHFTAAKQSQTRKSRIEACTPKIMAGFGMNDCTCGLSKRKPTCDGSHKLIR